MERPFCLLVATALLLATFATRAATIANTYQVTASSFLAINPGCASHPAGPVDPVNLAFSISFDNGAPITDSTANITLISLNMPNDGPLIYTYGSDDSLTVGDGPHAWFVAGGANFFSLVIRNISTNPTFTLLDYTVSSPAISTGCIFETPVGNVISGPPWTHLQFPMTGVRLGQTIRLNVVAGPVRPVGPCEAQLNIYDAANNLVASKSVSPPGNVTLDYSLRSALSGGGRPALRKELRPELILMPLPGTAEGACQALATTEVYDDLTKSTSAIISEKAPGPGGLPSGQFGPVGVGFLQTLRFNVAAYPPNPCSGTVSFTDVEGNPIGAASPVRLTGGQATFVDLPGTAIPSDSGHGEVMAAFKQEQGTCTPSVEVYDQLTGTTQAILPPDKNPGPAG
jgi:hypothetical protein